MIQAAKRFWDRVTRSEPPRSSSGYWGGRVPAGVVVTRAEMYKTAAVWACVRYLTNIVGQLPWHVVREMPNGDMERLVGHSVEWLLNDEPNPEWGAFSFRQTMLGLSLLAGNAYAEIERDMRGRPIARHRSRDLGVDFVTPALDLDGSVLVNTRALVEEALKNPALFSSENLVEQGNTLPLIPLNIDGTGSVNPSLREIVVTVGAVDQLRAGRSGAYARHASPGSHPSPTLPGERSASMFHW